VFFIVQWGRESLGMEKKEQNDTNEEKDMSDELEFLMGLWQQGNPEFLDYALEFREKLSPEERKRMLDLITVRYGV